jgi:hypothetical protein
LMEFINDIQKDKKTPEHKFLEGDPA